MPPPPSYLQDEEFNGDKRMNTSDAWSVWSAHFLNATDIHTIILQLALGKDARGSLETSCFPPNVVRCLYIVERLQRDPTRTGFGR